MLNIFERVLIYLCSFLFFPFHVFTIILVPIACLISAIYYLKNAKEKNRDREMLDMLTKFNNSLSSSDNPKYAYDKLGRFEYPPRMIHPEDDDFDYEIFKRQFLLFEKRILQREEIRAEFSVIRLRMQIMKWLPIVIIIFIKIVIGGSQINSVNIIAGIGFILNYHISNLIMEI